jgi:hypothetical protein
MRAWLSSVLATKPLKAGHKPRIWLVGNADRRPVAVSTHHIDRNAGYTGLAAQPTTSGPNTSIAPLTSRISKRGNGASAVGPG